MKLPAAVLTILLFSANLSAGVEVTVRANGRIDVSADDATLGSVFQAIALRGGVPVQFAADDSTVTGLRLINVTPTEAVERLASKAGLRVTRGDRVLTVRNSSRRALTLDVKDAPVREIIREVKKQCGIRNVMIDPQVEASGTFLLKDVPCDVALNVIFQSLGISAEIYPNSVLRVENRK